MWLPYPDSSFLFAACREGEDHYVDEWAPRGRYAKEANFGDCRHDRPTVGRGRGVPRICLQCNGHFTTVKSGGLAKRSSDLALQVSEFNHKRKRQLTVADALERRSVPS